MLQKFLAEVRVPMEIKRDLYLKKLIARKNNGMIKVVTGVRRTGKSYLLFNLFKKYLLDSGIDKNHIIEVNLDDISYIEFRNPLALYNYIKNKIIDEKMYFIMLDEVQFVDNFEIVLNSLLHIENVDVYVTGSNAKFLSKDIITEFRGRGDQVHIYPLSFGEFYATCGGDKTDAFSQYMTYGGLPQIVMMSAHEQKKTYLENLFEETYIKDIVNRHNIKNDSDLKELLNILSSSIGSLTNPNKLSNTFKSVKQSKISPITIDKYLDYLIDSFLISRATRFDIKGKKYIETPHKYYFTDLGLRNAKINFRQTEITHLMENAIYNELVVRGFSVDVGVINSAERNENNNVVKKQLEVDFVCNKYDQRIYIQSAYTLSNVEKLMQEQNSLSKINDSFKKIIITFDPVITHYNDNGFCIMNIFDFLLNPSSIN